MTWLDRLLGRTTDRTADALTRARHLASAGDYAGALKIWDKLGRRGVPRACNNIGACFAEGLGVERDPDVALHWITRAAEAGDPVAQRNRAAMHFRGEGVAQSDAEAARLYRIAAENGDAPSQDMLSFMLLEGLGLDANPADARHWAERAAAGGMASAMTRLGTIHNEAKGTSRDPEKGCGLLAPRGRSRRRGRAGAPRPSASHGDRHAARPRGGFGLADPGAERRVPQSPIRPLVGPSRQ